MGKKSRQKQRKRTGGLVVQVQLTPAQQEENAKINDIAQYVAAKWGKPAIVVLFMDIQSSGFRAHTVNNPTEGQFLIAGRECEAMGQRIQAIRLDQQFKVSLTPR